MKRNNCLPNLKAFILLAFALIMMTALPTAIAQLQDPGKEKVPGGRQLEIPSGEYTPSPRETHPRSAAYRYFAEGFSIVQVNVDENGDNILNDAANEPSISYNSENPDEMVIGWRQFDNINNSFRQAGYGFTTDGGQTWTFPGVIDPGIFRSDPVLRNDSQGNIYYNSLTSQDGNYWTNVYNSTDGGGSWEMGTFAQGGDKQWMSVDMTDGIGGGNIYEFWNGAYSLCTPNNFTRSVDGNESYESCSYIPGGPYWGTTMVSPSGDLYVCGAEWGGFMVAKSSSAQDPGDNVSWDWTVSVNLGGEVIGFGGDECPNPEGLLGQTIIAMDSSGGPGNGNIYLLCSVQRFTNSDPCDVMFARSTDGGLSWSLPVRVNDDLSNFAYQWFGTMSVAPDGRIDAIWLDTRGNLSTINSAMYYSYSLDQGITWSPNVKLSDAFNPHIGWPQQFKMGDYFDMYSDDAGAHLAWTATFNGEQDVYYSLITPSYVGLVENENGNENLYLINYPNPFKAETTIRYWLSASGNVSIKVFNTSGKEVATVLNEIRGAGMHELIFDASGLESGIYFYQLNSGEKSCRNKFIVLK
jgi:hypothetical protein